MATDSARKARQSAGKGPRRQTGSARAAAWEPESSPADRIWLVVSRIPPGSVTSYGAVARLAGLPRHARLVGRTLAALPAASRLPWHRVVNAALRLSPRGDPAGVAEQRRRLAAEGVRFIGDRVAPECLWTP